jgi:type I restriction enzyme S subunit
MGERELPEGWVWKTLGDVLQFSRNGANLKQDKSGNGIPISRIETISFGIINPNKVGYTQETDDNTIQTCKLIDGDLLFSHINSLEHIGKTAIYENNPPVLLHGINLLLLRPNKKIVDPKFLHILFQKYRREKIFWSMANKSVNQASINLTRLNAIRMPLPPLHVQRQIVAVLEQAEAVKRQRLEADALTGALLQSVFFEMFGNPVTNERGWPLHKMKNVCKKITDGTHDTPEPTFTGVPFIMGKHIRDRIIDFPNSLFVSKNMHDEIYRRCNPQQGDVILVHIGANLGNAAFISVPFEFSMKNIALLKPNPSLINGRYLESYLIFTKQNTKKIVSRGGAQQFMSIKEMELIPCLLPPLALQQQFARVVQDVERIRDRQLASGKEIEGLCEGLMARAFAGELVV